MRGDRTMTASSSISNSKSLMNIYLLLEKRRQPPACPGHNFVLMVGLSKRHWAEGVLISLSKSTWAGGVINSRPSKRPGQIE